MLFRSAGVQPAGKSTVKPVSSVYVVEFVGALIGCTCCSDGADVANAAMLVIIKTIDSMVIKCDNNNNMSELIIPYVNKPIF